MTSLLVLLALTGAVAMAGAEPAQSALHRAADQILSHQVDDGAIAMGREANGELRVIPYFSSLGALGLVAAYREGHQARYLEAAKRWAEWYGAHEDRDGTVKDYTGRPGSWRSTGHYDSTDSYAGT